MECCEVLSPQEERLKEEMLGHGAKYEKDRERVFNILKGFQMQRPRIDIERAKYFTDSMRQTEGQHLTLRWAKALKTIAEKMTVYIDDHQLMVGRSGQPGRYGILYPELDGDFLDMAVQQLSTRTQSPFDISPKDAQVVIDEIAPYWKGKTYHEALAVALPEDTARYTFNPEDPPDVEVHRQRNILLPLEPPVGP